jgi:serine/threonine protein kinase/lipoprotein NlpI
MDDPTISMRMDGPPSPQNPTPKTSGPKPASTPPLTSWGPFELLERVGEGGFGEVYRARDPKLDREIAVKLLRASAFPDDDYSTVLREARLAARVRHPNVVTVYGVEQYDGRVGFWADFVRGKTLAQLVTTHGPYGARESALIGIELCRALGAMHAIGLIHRDIKASNAMREEGGRILLMDFGLSSDAASASNVAGTPDYMAPELFDRTPPSVATDIYALGVLLFFLASARYPTTGRGNTRRRLIDERPDLPEAFTRVVETAIDPDPARRYSSTGAMLAGLSDSLGVSQPVETRPAAKRRWLIPAIAAAVLAGGGIGYLAFNRAHRSTIELPSGANEDYMRAMALLQREDKRENVDQALKLFSKIIAQEPRSALAHSGLARAYTFRHESDNARIEAQKALELAPDLASVHVTAGNIYSAMNRYDLATNELQQAVRLDPTSAEAQAGLAALYAAQGRNSDAVAAFQKAIDLGPDDWRWPNRLGSYYLARGNYADAAEQYKRVIALTPDNASGLINLGIAYRRQDRLTEAEATLRQALALKPNSPDALSRLGTVLLMQGKYDEAAQQYRQAVALSPRDWVLHADLAAAYQWAGRKPESREQYLTAIDLAENERKHKPRAADLLANLGSFYAAVDKPQNALPLLRQAMALAPEDPTVLVSVGEGYEIIGHRKEALDAVLKALDLGASRRQIDHNPDLVQLRKDPKYLAHLTKRM